MHDIFLNGSSVVKNSSDPFQINDMAALHAGFFRAELMALLIQNKMVTVHIDPLTTQQMMEIGFESLLTQAKAFNPVVNSHQLKLVLNGADPDLQSFIFNLLKGE